MRSFSTFSFFFSFSTNPFNSERGDREQRTPMPIYMILKKEAVLHQMLVLFVCLFFYYLSFSFFPTA